MRIAVELLGERQAVAMLSGIARRVEAPQAAADDILADIRQMVSRQFASRGTAQGTPWQPLKQATVDAKRRSKDARTRSNAEKPLEATDAMRRSLTDRRRRAGASHATKDEVVLATTLRRAVWHHKGVPSRHLPARPLIHVRQRDIQRWERILLRHITRSA